jgi:acetoin utilization protein AcuC
MGLLKGDVKTEIAPIPAEQSLMEKFHSARYLRALKNAVDGDQTDENRAMGIGSADCPIFEGLYDYAVLACGGTLIAAKMILDGSAEVAFNPSGGYHHAGPEHASGFCYINDVAIACTILAQAGKRVLYLDVDVHHGDGVANAFYDRSDVLTMSFHENPAVLFPGTGFENEIGTGPGKGYCVNVPLPIGTYDEAYMKAFESIALPLIGAYNPDVFVFELGADALAGDPLADLCLTNNVYAEIIKHLLSFNKPILATGGGGYNVDNTARAWALAWGILCGQIDEYDLNLGIGGVMLASTDWPGGLRDRGYVVSDRQKNTVMPIITKTIEAVKANVFAFHGLHTNND